MPTKREKEMRFVKNDGKDARRKGRRAGRMTVVMAVVALLCLAAVLFVACNKHDELPATSPVSWEHYLSDAADRIADNIVLTGGKLSATLTAAAEMEEGSYSLLIGFNYDISSRENSCFVIEVTDATATTEAAESAAEEGLLFSLVSNSGMTWIDIAPGLALADARMKIENLNIYDLFGTIYDGTSSGAAREVLSDIIFNIGKAFFGGVRVSGDGSVLRFIANEDYKSEGAGYFSAVLDIFGSEVSSALLAAFGIDDTAELFSMLPDLSGEVTVAFTENGADVSTEGLTIASAVTGVEASFTTSHELSATLAAKVPDGTEVGYVTTKIGNAHMSGSISLYDGGNERMRYDYELDSNLDLLTLVLNGYDLTKLDEDNYFHLRVTHACTATCGEFCESKYAAARGAVLDIAFSPTDFGSYNVYFSIALQALMPKERAEWLNSEMRTLLTSNLLPEYTLITYPCELFTEGSPVQRMLTGLYAGNMFATGSVTVPVDDSDPMISSAAALLGEDWMGGADRIVINIAENDFGMAQPHDIYSETVFIIDGGIGDVKDYALHSAGLALSWEWEEPATVAETGEELTNIYAEDHTLLHGADAEGKYVPMSREEIMGMLGEYYLKITAVNIDKTAAAAPKYMRVTDVKDIDIDSDEVQTVTFTVEYPNPLKALGMESYSAFAASVFVTEVRANIRLTDRATAEVVFTPHVDVGTELEIVHADTTSLGVYNGQRTSIPEFLYADAEVEYANGDKKSTTIVGSTEAVGTRDAIFATYYYSTMCGRVEVEWDFLGDSHVGTYDIKKPDRVEFEVREDSMPSHSVGETVYLSTITNHITAMAYYKYDDGTEKQIRLYLAAGNIFINGIPLTSSSSYWKSERMLLGGYTVTFNTANDYSPCYAEIFGERSDTFVQHVEAYLGDDATYRFEQTSTDPVFWFTGKDYKFKGRIVNATHGINRYPSRTLSITVTKNYDGSARSNDNLDISGEGGDVTLVEFGADSPFTAGSTAGQMTTDSFPALIVTGIGINFTLRFNEPGYYRLRLRLGGDGGFAKDWYITVADISSNSVMS